MSDQPISIEELQKAYDAASLGSYEPNCVVTATELARKYMSPEEVALVDGFLAANPGKGWYLDRKAMTIEAFDQDPPDHEDEEEDDTLPCHSK